MNKNEFNIHFLKVENEELKDKEDFAVVLQPFTENLIFPRNRYNTTDMSYLSTDCFHFSQKGYARGEVKITISRIIISH